MPIDFNRSFASMSLDGAGRVSPPAIPAGAPGVPDAGADNIRRTQPRIIANSALQALKALGPRLTPAQRTSIGILENYAGWRTGARTNGDMFDNVVQEQTTRETQMTLARRPSFLLIKPMLDDLDTLVPSGASEMGLPRTIEERTALTALVAAAHEQVETLKNRAVDDAVAGQRLCPLTLETELFAGFLNENRTLLEHIIDNSNSLATKGTLEKDLATLADNYLKGCGLHLPGLEPEDIPQELAGDLTGAPVIVEIIDGYDEPGHELLGNEESGCCLITLSRRGLTAVAHAPDYMFHSEFGLTEDFARCAPNERAASMYLQHLFFELAQIEQVATLGELTDNETILEHRPAMHTLMENHYEGSMQLGDDCEDNTSTQRGNSLSSLARMRHFVGMHDQDNGTPLLTDPALNKWVKGTEFSNDTACLTTPVRRIERAQITAVSDALRATGVFTTLPAEPGNRFS